MYHRTYHREGRAGDFDRAHLGAGRRAEEQAQSEGRGDEDRHGGTGKDFPTGSDRPIAPDP